MFLRFLGRFKRFAAVGGSDGVLRGFGEWLEEDPIGRFCMLNRRNCTRNGHDWNPKPHMELESSSGEGRIFGRGVREKGGSDEPPWLRACGIHTHVINMFLACMAAHLVSFFQLFFIALLLTAVY